MTPNGFIYPGFKSSIDCNRHPKRPHDSRILELTKVCCIAIDILSKYPVVTTYTRVLFISESLSDSNLHQGPHQRRDCAHQLWARKRLQRAVVWIPTHRQPLRKIFKKFKFVFFCFFFLGLKKTYLEENNKNLFA